MQTVDEVRSELERLAGRSFTWPQPWIEMVAPQAIRHFAHGSGDHNPRWVDPESLVGKVAPPLFPVAAMTDAVPGTSLGTDPGRWTRVVWHNRRLLAPGDRVQARGTIGDVRQVGRGLSYTLRVGFVDQQGEEVAAAEIAVQRPVRLEPAEPREPYHYDEAQVEAIETAIAEEPFETGTIWWEDVAIGSALPVLVRGPLNHFDIAFHFAGVGFTWKVGSSTERPERRFFEDGPARAQGLPGASAPSSLHLVWLTTQLTNWIGDGGALVDLAVDLGEPPVIGDVTWYYGEVVRKWQSGAEHFVAVGLSAKNQLGNETAKGEATIKLPARG